MTGDKIMNHGEYQRKCKKMSIEALRYTIKDAREVIKNYPENPNSGFYADEINYCVMEIRKRERENEDKIKCGKLIQSLVNKGD